ncbi:MAG: substrate-binding domain-containing protein [Acidobacteriales bacterium]|nr:substrate-binding domain-containing protein [Terriglobales bacterium]
MNRYRFLRACFFAVLLCFVPLMFAADTSSGPPISVLYAGSLDEVMNKGLAPGFAATGKGTVQGESLGSLAAADSIRNNSKKPDVFISADRQINLSKLMFPVNGSRIAWYVSLATSELVVAYNPRSTFAAQFADAAKLPWYKVLASPGLHFGRSDPATDPLGYRTLFLFNLAAKHYQQPELAKFLAGAPNSSQISVEGDLPNRLQSGQLDAAVLYKFQAVLAKLPFVTLPPEINLGDQKMAKAYATESYTTPSGIRIPGAPITFTATVPENAAHYDAAVQFVDYAVRADDLWKQYGFDVIHHTLTGNPGKVPTALDRFIMVAHPPMDKHHQH